MTSLASAIAAHEADGYRLDMITPADDPTTAVLSRPSDGATITLTGTSTVGRAGMEYRDLLPDRLGGHVIASHIRIPDGGPVPDSVHFHEIGFQVIVCRAGWVRVVYEDQGPPFVMVPGDVVLQPPLIRHRVLEASPGLEVVELASPAQHPTRFDHVMTLPTPGPPQPERTYGAGQRFVRSVAATAPWSPSPVPGWEARETDVATATGGLAGVRHLRPSAASAGSSPAPWSAPADLFRFVTSGAVEVDGLRLEPDDSFLTPAGRQHTLTPLNDPAQPTELLEITLPPPRPHPSPNR